MTYRKLWVEVLDRPGQLGSVAAALGAAGIDVVAVDIHPLGEANMVSDELTVRMPAGPPVDLGQVVGSIRGVRFRGVAPVDPHRLVDAVTEALQAGSRLLVGDGPPTERMARMVGTVVQADLVTVGAGSADVSTGLVGRASRAMEPVMELAWLHRLPGDPPAMAWSLAVPQAGRTAVWVALLARSHRRFSPTDTARAHAALALAVSVVDGAEDGAEDDVLPELDRRCD